MISNINVSQTSTQANIDWITNIPSVGALKYGESTAYELGAVGPTPLSIFHSITLPGLTAGSIYNFQVAATSEQGVASQSINQSFEQMGQKSDEFNSANLNISQWSVLNPLGDGIASLSGTQLLLGLPGGIAHDVWTNTNDSLRIMESISNQDFEAQVKFNSVPVQSYQMQGIMVEQDSSNFIRFDYYSDGSSLYVFSAVFVNGEPTIKVNSPVGYSGSPLYIKITRAGDMWSLFSSSDAVSWIEAGSFSHVLNTTALGLFAANAGNNPAFTVDVDWIRVLQ